MIQRVLRKLTRVEPASSVNRIQIDESENNAEAFCSGANCSSYNFGFPLRSCLRACAGIGMASSFLYIIAGCSLITHIASTENVGFSAYTVPDEEILPASPRHIYYKKNVGFFIGVGVILVLLSTVQLLSDLFLLLSTFREKNHNSLWTFLVLDVTVWILMLVCFITIFSGGGMFLLLVFLIGTAIRAYIAFILHEYTQESSKEDSDDRTGKQRNKPQMQEIAANHIHTISQGLSPSPIPEEICIENNGVARFCDKGELKK